MQDYARAVRTSPRATSNASSSKRLGSRLSLLQHLPRQFRCLRLPSPYRLPSRRSILSLTPCPTRSAATLHGQRPRVRQVLHDRQHQEGLLGRCPGNRPSELGQGSAGTNWAITHASRSRFSMSTVQRFVLLLRPGQRSMKSTSPIYFIAFTIIAVMLCIVLPLLIARGYPR